MTNQHTNDCQHEWEDFDGEPGAYRNSVCIHCNAYRHLDLVTNVATIDINLEDGEIERDGNLYCGSCGMLAAPGCEEYDFCDHRTGEGCSYMQEDDDEPDDDDQPDDYNEFDFYQPDIDESEPRARY